MGKHNTIITIGRQYGSCGRLIGQAVANHFEVKCFDKELLEHASSESGISKQLFEQQDEKPVNSFLYSLVMDTYAFGGSKIGIQDIPLNHKVFLAQFDAIKKLAGQGPCVMVGRCADYALEDNPNLFSVYIHASLDFRKKHVAERFGKSEAEAKDMILKADKQRASYYNYYTNKKWGEAAGYSLCLDSSVLGVEGATEAIIHAVELFEKNKR